MKKLRWQMPDRELPKHPYRDSVLVYAFLAGIVVLVAVLTGGSLERALLIAGVAFVIATVYSWWRWREKLKAKDRELR
jgi:hypothetical protein